MPAVGARLIGVEFGQLGQYGVRHIFRSAGASKNTSASAVEPKLNKSICGELACACWVSSSCRTLRGVDHAARYARELCDLQAVAFVRRTRLHLVQEYDGFALFDGGRDARFHLRHLAGQIGQPK